MSNLSRRAFLAAAGGLATLPAVALAANQVQQSVADFDVLFAEWKRLYNYDHASLSDEESAEYVDRCIDLGERIVLSSAATERHFAIQYHVATFAGSSEPSFLFQDKMAALLLELGGAAC